MNDSLLNSKLRSQLLQNFEAPFAALLRFASGLLCDSEQLRTRLNEMRSGENSQTSSVACASAQLPSAPQETIPL